MRNNAEARVVTNSMLECLQIVMAIKCTVLRGFCQSRTGPSKVPTAQFFCSWRQHKAGYPCRVMHGPITLDRRSLTLSERQQRVGGR